MEPDGRKDEEREPAHPRIPEEALEAAFKLLEELRRIAQRKLDPDGANQQ